MNLPDFHDLPSGGIPDGVAIGESREGRPIHAHRFGSGAARVSLIAGCHADEPVGPWLLERVVAHLATAGQDSPALALFDWWIVPHVNPDGRERNRAWSDDAGDAFDVGSYLRHVVREAPGDDIEFGFPRDAHDAEARPENRAVNDWWRSDDRPFAMHATLHGMAFAGGPWFLIEPAWVERSAGFRDRCRDATQRLGYALHDVERNGEKGFHRIERGFCTRPDSRAMATYFFEQNDPDTASRFRPNSMETVRSFGGDALTLVSEMPLFVLPGVGDRIAPKDPRAEAWRERLTAWKQRAENGEEVGVSREAINAGLTPLPIRDQMELQWEMIRAGLVAASSQP